MSVQPFAPLDSETHAALKASIERFGVVVPIVVDGNGQILDGHHRFAIAKELGIDCPTVKRSVRNEDDATALAYSLNAHRRMLSTDERRRIVADLRQRGYSLRAIQGVTGASLSTIHNDVERTGAKPEGEVTGKDNKSYQPTRSGVRPEHVDQDATQQGAGDDGPTSEGDATSGGDGADSHDVGRTEPEPAPTTSEGESQAPPVDAPGDSPPVPPVDPALGYRATATRFRAQVRQSLLTLDPARVIDTSDEPDHWAEFSQDVHAWLRRLDDAIRSGRHLRAVK